MDAQKEPKWSERDIFDHIQGSEHFNSPKINHILELGEKRQRGKAKGKAERLEVVKGGESSANQLDFQDRGQEEDGYHEHHAYGSKPQERQEPREQQQLWGFGQELANLSQMYADELKYDGEYDVFDYKLVIFKDMCARADIPETQRTKAYPTMLRGLALDHYYTNVAPQGVQNMSFDQICDATRGYFEAAGYSHEVLNRWEAISLRSTMRSNANAGKSTKLCLLVMVQELRHLQYGLDPCMRTDKFLYNKLLTACEGVRECRYAYYNRSKSLDGLVHDLRASITLSENSGMLD